MRGYGVQLGLWIAVSNAIWGLGLPSKAEDSPIRQNDIEQNNLIAQGLPIQIDRVEIKQTDQGFTIGLNALTGTISEPLTRTQENLSFTDIPNAVLVLPDRTDFRQENPAPGIAYIEVKQEVNNFVRVIVVGTEKTPEVVITTSGQAVSFAVKKTDRPPLAQTPSPAEEIELTVTGDRTPSYRVPNSSTATKTDTPLRDIPQSIQVIPQKVIKDQAATGLLDILKNVPGAVQGFRSPRRGTNEFNLRGFFAGPNLLLDGTQLRVSINQPIIDFSPNIEQVEVLKGPASVLFGSGELGGTINFVSKKPLPDPRYEIEVTGGSFGALGSSFDFTGALNENKTVLYRLTGSAETTRSFVDFFEQQRYTIAPTVSFQFSDQTKLTLGVDYRRISISGTDYGVPIQGTIIPNPNGRIPRNRYLGEPSFASTLKDILLATGDLEHRFNKDWQVRGILRYTLTDESIRESQTSALDANLQTISRFSFEIPKLRESALELDSFVVGKFDTGSIKHNLVAGFNLFKQDRLIDFRPTLNSPPSINIFNPIYERFTPISGSTAFGLSNKSEGLGVYLQDQIELASNLKLLLGGRFDLVGIDSEDLVSGTSQFQQDTAFSPRVGIVYQPVPLLSLYASYASSFNPQLGSTFSGQQFLPLLGTQYEVGIKADLTDKISTTLAFYDLTRSNVLTTDTANPQFSIQTGEQRSRGIELDVSGEILPGWNIIAGYALTDPRITRDNNLPVGNLLDNAPQNTFNLWTTYEIQSGDLQGLGFGMGFFYVGERQGDLNNSFQLPSYLRTDAAIFYQRGQMRFALNFKNLFDVEYFASAQTQTRVYFGDPFAVQATVSWRF